MNLTNYIKNRIEVTQYQIGVLQTRLNDEIKKNVNSQAIINQLQAKLNQLTKLYEIKTLGSSTELVNTGKFADMNQFKVYSSVNSIKMNFCTDKWLYNNIEASLNVLSELVMNDMDSLTANLDTTKLVYLEPFTVENQTTQLCQKRILYYGDFISNTSNGSLDVEFINNQSNSLEFLWAKQHLPNKYYTQNGKYLLVGPDISLTNYKFMETVANDPLIKLNVNSTASLTYNVYSDNSEFHVGTFNGDTYLMASKDIKYDNYTNKTIKIKMVISDGKYTYVRVFFITVEKMLNSSTEFLAKYITNKNDDQAFFKYLLDMALGGKGISETFITSLLSTTVITDNCLIMQQLQSMNDLMGSDPKYSTVKTKVSETISSFRAITSVNDAKSFATIAKNAITSGSTVISGLDTQILNTGVDTIVEFIETLFALPKIPKTPVPLAVATVEQSSLKLAKIGVDYKLVIVTSFTNLLQVNTQIEQQQNKNVLPPLTEKTGSGNVYNLPSEFYTKHNTYKYYISSDLINKITWEDKIGELYIESYNSYAYPYIKIIDGRYHMYFAAITSDWKNVSDNSTITSTAKYYLPNTGTKYDLKIELTYESDRKTHIKISTDDTVVADVYTLTKIESFKIPNTFLVN
jgi:hypothetical protein